MMWMTGLCRMSIVHVGSVASPPSLNIIQFCPPHTTTYEADLVSASSQGRPWHSPSIRKTRLSNFLLRFVRLLFSPRCGNEISHLVNLSILRIVTYYVYYVVQTVQTWAAQVCRPSRRKNPGGLPVPECRIQTTCYLVEPPRTESMGRAISIPFVQPASIVPAPSGTCVV